MIGRRLICKIAYFRVVNVSDLLLIVMCIRRGELAPTFAKLWSYITSIVLSVAGESRKEYCRVKKKKSDMERLSLRFERNPLVRRKYWTTFQCAETLCLMVVHTYAVMILLMLHSTTEFT